MEFPKYLEIPRHELRWWLWLGLWFSFSVIGIKINGTFSIRNLFNPRVINEINEPKKERPSSIQKLSRTRYRAKTTLISFGHRDFSQSRKKILKFRKFQKIPKNFKNFKSFYLQAFELHFVAPDSDWSNYSNIWLHLVTNQHRHRVALYLEQNRQNQFWWVR